MRWRPPSGCRQDLPNPLQELRLNTLLIVDGGRDGETYDSGQQLLASPSLAAPKARLLEPREAKIPAFGGHNKKSRGFQLARGRIESHFHGAAVPAKAALSNSTAQSPCYIGARGKHKQLRTIQAAGTPRLPRCVIAMQRLIGHDA